MMTEGRAGFRAFHEGSKACREADFLLLRRRLAEGAAWGDALIDEILAQAHGAMTPDGVEPPHRDPAARAAATSPASCASTRIHTGAAQPAVLEARVPRVPRAGAPARRASALAADVDGDGSPASCSATSAPSSSAPSRAAGSSRSASIPAQARHGIALARCSPRPCRRFARAGVVDGAHDGAAQRRAGADVLPHERLRRRRLTSQLELVASTAHGAGRRTMDDMSADLAVERLDDGAFWRVTLGGVEGQHPRRAR